MFVEEPVKSGVNQRLSDKLWNTHHNLYGSSMNLSIDLTNAEQKKSKSVNNKERKCVYNRTQ